MNLEKCMNVGRAGRQRQIGKKADGDSGQGENKTHEFPFEF